MDQQQGGYTLYSSRDLIKKIIVEQVYKTNFLKADVEIYYKAGYTMAGSKRFYSFYTAFNELFGFTCNYLKAVDQNELKGIRSTISNPDWDNPEKLFQAFNKYNALLVSSGLLELGYEEKNFRDKIRDKG